MVEIGKTYKFNVIDTFLTKNNNTMYRLVLTDEQDDSEYCVFKMKTQVDDITPKCVYCQIIGTDEYGRYRLCQNEYETFASFYKQNEIYTFHVDSLLDPSKNGKKRYLVTSEFGLQHVFTCHYVSELQVGKKIRLKVSLKEGENNRAILYLNLPNDNLEGFTPLEVFKGSGHISDFEYFFNDLKHLKDTSDRVNSLIIDIEDKLNQNNRLWIFDYLTALYFISFLYGIENLEMLKRINILIKDIEIWLLEESGILSKFNVDRREETKIKSEAVIARAEATIEAINIICENRQREFLNDVLSKLRKSMYLRNREHVFLVLFSIIVVEKDFLKENIIEISELIDFTTSEIKDTYTIDRIVSILYSHIINERKRIDYILHYDRVTEVDHDLLSNLIVGIGTLLNFDLDREDSSPFGIKINQRQLFAALCKYLGYISTKDKALDLINKSLTVYLQNKNDIKISGKILRNVKENSDELVDFILSIDVSKKHKLLKGSNANIYIQYSEGQIEITNVASRYKLGYAESLISSVYSIPGTFLNVGSVIEKEKWIISNSLLYYKDKWKNMFSNTIIESPISNEENIEIITKEMNDKYPSMIFCKRSDINTREDGVIRFNGYANCFLSEDLNKIFEANLYFKAEKTVNNNGHVFFDIKKNILDFSNFIADNTNEVVLGLCINPKSYENEAVFITENGVLCVLELTSENSFKMDDVYQMTLDVSLNRGVLPLAIIVSKSNKELDKLELLKNQLRLLSEYNKNRSCRNYQNFPYIHLILDDYLRLCEDKIVRYNLYHIARLVSLLEKSTLSLYYSACIQYMEMMESLKINETVDSSLPDSILDEKLLENFPSLRNFSDKYNLLRNFGTEKDLEYLFKLSTKSNSEDEVVKFASLSLAASLIESVSNDNQIVAYLRKIASGYFEKAEVKDHVPANMITNADDESSQDLYEDKNYGSEGQDVEFKTSIVHTAGKGDDQLLVIMKVINGFLNADGGKIYIGVKDDGTVSGIESDYEDLNCDRDYYERKIRAAIVANFNKDVNSQIEIIFNKQRNKTVCVISIPKYERPISLGNDFYQRQGNETRIIKGEDLVMFISRRLEGKITLISNTKPNTDIENISNNIIIDDTNAKNNNNVVVNFYSSGTYILNTTKDDSALSVLEIDNNDNTSYILQCYDNGCINKIPTKNLFNLKFNYLYKNGLYTDAKLTNQFLLKNTDYVVVVSVLDNIQYVKVVPISDISIHTTLGLKGNQIIPQKFDSLISINPLEHKDANYVSKLITTNRTILGYDMSSSVNIEEILWLKENVLHNISIKEIDFEDELSSLDKLVEDGDNNKIISYFDKLLSKGRYVPKARNQAMCILKRCKDKNKFWFIINTLLDCNIEVFRNPISAVISELGNIMEFIPIDKTLDIVVNKLFTFDYKYSHSIEFIYPFRSNLSYKSREYIQKKTTSLSLPEDYVKFFEITNMTFEKSCEYLLSENNITSSYTLFDLLRNHSFKERNLKNLKFIEDIMCKIPLTLPANRYTFDLILFIILKRKPKFFKIKELSIINQRGFDSYNVACLSLSNKERSDEFIEKLDIYIRRVLTGKIIGEIKNHYIISYNNGVFILLPHNWASKKHYIDDMVSVKIMSVSKLYKTMFGTEIYDTSDLPEKLPILSLGDIVQVKFSEINGHYIPELKGSYSRLKVRVTSFPSNFDYHKKYEAVVTKVSNDFEIDIRPKTIINI